MAGIVADAIDTAQMSTRANNDTVTGEAVTPQPVPHPGRPVPPPRNLTDSGQTKPLYALPNHPPGTRETTRTTSTASFANKPGTELNRVYNPPESDALRSGFYCSASEYSEPVHRDEAQVDHMAYGNDNRGQEPKEKPVIGRAAHKIKKRMKEGRRDADPDNSHDIDRYRAEADRSRVEADRHRADVDIFRAEAQKLKRLVEEYDQENAGYKAVIARLRGEVDQEKDRVERTKRSANMMQTTMDNRELFLGDQAHDDDVCGTFSGLLTAIKTWSTRFSGGKSDAFKEESISEYQRVVPWCTEVSHLEGFVSSKKRKRLIVRGWTAYIMSKALFRTFDSLGDLGTDVWLETRLADDFLYLENALWYSDRKAVSHRSFNDWRAFTAELLSKAIATEDYNKKTEDHTLQVVIQAAAEVINLVAPWHVTGDPDELRIDEDNLCRIFNDAISFAQMLRCQRAMWSIRFPSRPMLPKLDETGPLMFDPTCMKDDRGDDDDMSPDALRQRYVENVVTPALYKRGTMNGERFDSEEAAIPAVVVMGGV